MESRYTVKFQSVEKHYTSMDLRRGRKRFLKFRKMLETQGYTHKPWMQKRGDKEKPSQREGTHFKIVLLVYVVWLVAFTVIIGHNLPFQTL